MRTGILSAALAFLCWGLFPLYFHAISEVPPEAKKSDLVPM